MWNTRTCSRYADREILLCRSSKKKFEQEILKSVFNGLHVGDINHSSELYLNIMPFVSEQVSTGFKLPVNLQSDKGINVHRARQFTSVVVVVPESPKLLTYIYLCQPVVKSDDGPGVARISKEIKWKVEALMDKIFILQKLYIFRTNLFVGGIFSIREM